jgi:hypothetical protein
VGGVCNYYRYSRTIFDPAQAKPGKDGKKKRQKQHPQGMNMKKKPHGKKEKQRLEMGAEGNWLELEGAE